MNISLTPELRRFVEKKVSEGSFKNAGDVVRDALRSLMEIDRLRRLTSSGLRPSAPSLPVLTGTGLAGGDIAAMCYIVLLEATQDTDADLALIMGEVKAMTAAKQALRTLLNKVGRDVAANAWQADGQPPLNLSSGLGSAGAYYTSPMPTPDAGSSGGVTFTPVNLVPGSAPLTTVAQLRAILSSLQATLDSMNELSEIASLRLQMIMDRRSKLVCTLSNILKKISVTEETLVQNMK
jgi:putative addiction module CopG family antidote